MAYTFEELKKKNISDLREIAKAEGVTGYTQMNKEHLLEKVCGHLNIDMYVHHKVVGVDKKSIKAEIKKLKIQRDKNIADKKTDDLRKTRSEIKKLKKTLRSATI